VIAVEVPPLIDQVTFDAVQAHLRSRNPKVTPARVVSGPTLLTGICFCAKCSGAMTLRTGKGNRYRYYTCSTKARQGETGCVGRSVPMDKLDNLVAGSLLGISSTACWLPSGWISSRPNSRASISPPVHAGGFYFGGCSSP
jgi:site-specific DNA recombinase